MTMTVVAFILVSLHRKEIVHTKETCKVYVPGSASSNTIVTVLLMNWGRFRKTVTSAKENNGTFQSCSEVIGGMKVARWSSSISENVTAQPSFTTMILLFQLVFLVQLLLQYQPTWGRSGKRQDNWSLQQSAVEKRGTQCRFLTIARNKDVPFTSYHWYFFHIHRRPSGVILFRE